MAAERTFALVNFSILDETRHVLIRHNLNSVDCQITNNCTPISMIKNTSPRQKVVSFPEFISWEFWMFMIENCWNAWWFTEFRFKKNSYGSVQNKTVANKILLGNLLLGFIQLHGSIVFTLSYTCNCINPRRHLLEISYGVALEFRSLSEPGNYIPNRDKTKKFWRIQVHKNRSHPSTKIWNVYSKHLLCNYGCVVMTCYFISSLPHQTH